MRNFSVPDQFLFGLMNATLLFTLAYSILGMRTQFELGFGIEDGPIEYGTAIGLILACLILVWHTVSMARFGRYGSAAFLALYALAFLFGAGEEISWGQRIFGWQTTEFFMEHNRQLETNIHNIAVGESQLAKTLFGSILTTVILLYLVVLPLVYPRVTLIARLTDAIMLPLPQMRHAVMALGASILIATVIDVPRKWESYEFIFSLIMMSIFLAPGNAHRFGTSR
ncbi:hypothetical protein [Roseovarius sp.]|uniref:hypothetical protein n=2 Tax=Roseovarius TaxID=74030 RepID=UPI003568AC35